MCDAPLRSGLHPIGDDEIPVGWDAVELGAVASTVGGGRLGLTKEKDYRPSGVAAFSAAGQDGFVEMAEYRDTHGVVLSAIGANCGRCFAASGDWTTLANTQAIVPESQLDAGYLFHRVNQDGYWPRSGSAQPFIKPSDVLKCWLLLPPTDEQRSIAAVLDTADEAIRKTVGLIAKLKMVKQGLVHDLLTRGADESGVLRASPDETPSLYVQTPLGTVSTRWPIRRLTELADVSGGVTLGRKLTGGETCELPYLRVANVQDGYIDTTEMKTVRILTSELRRYVLQPGDVLMNEGGDFDKLGRGAVWDGRVSPCLHQNHVFRVRCRDRVLLPDYLAFLSASRYGKKYFLASSKQTTNLASINSTQLKAFPIPLPTIAEQKFIVDCLATYEETEAAEAAALRKLRSLRTGLVDDLLTGRVRVPVPDEANA